MFRMTSASILALASVGLATAGQIQIGGTNGLTSSYVSSGCSGGGPCVAGSAGTATEQNYDNVLFSGALNGGTAPTPYAGYSTSSANAGTITDSTNGVTFSMVNDGTTGGASNNFWAIPSSPSTTIVIPIGVFGVTDVWTMLNTELAKAPPSRDINVTFNFGTTSNAATTQSYIVKAGNSSNSSTPSGQLQNAVGCTPVTGACGGVATPASGPAAAFSYPGTSTTPMVTNQVFSSAYTSASGAYAGSTGTVVLSDQGFLLGSLSLSSLGVGLTNLNTYLVSITVRDLAVPGVSAGALSAITVDTVPEPSTVFLLLTGLCAIGFSRFRRGRT